MMPLRNMTYALVLASVLALQSGCGDTASDRNGGRSLPGAPQEMQSRVGQLSMRPQYDGIARVGRDQLERIAEQVPGVDEAVIAMNDKEVVVGIIVDNDGKRRIAEKQVVSQLMWQYPEYDYYVTSDADLLGKVRTANQRQTAGVYRTKSVTSDNEISAIADEIASQMVKPGQGRRQ